MDCLNNFNRIDLMETKQQQEQEKPKKEGLDDDEEMIIEASEDLEVVKTFEELGLREELLRGKIQNVIINCRDLCIWI